MAPGQIEAPDDLCSLHELTEDVLLQSLRKRFDEGAIYTYVGSILVSINPFKYLPIYGEEYAEQYHGGTFNDPSVKPHIFAIADEAFHALLRNRANQCIVISGESGSGKTEATKLLLHHIMHVSGTSLQGDLRRILGSAPVLEVGLLTVLILNPLRPVAC